MITSLTSVLLAIATLYTAVTPAAAHGYVSFPMSRQARCRAGEIPGCGDVMYEPQSVEAPKGSFLCNGDGPRFAQLNNDALFANKYWTAAPTVETLTFVWSLTAAHRTTTWEYIVLTADKTVLATFDSHNTIPPYVVEHQVPLPRGLLSGKHTILARWNIGDTIHAFYSCVDILFETSTGTQTPVAAVAATPVPIPAPIPLPVAPPGPQLSMTTNGTGTADAGSLNMALPYVYIVQGASV